MSGKIPSVGTTDTNRKKEKRKKGRVNERRNVGNGKERESCDLNLLVFSDLVSGMITL